MNPIYDEFLRIVNGVVSIESFVTEKTPETETLDFKTEPKDLLKQYSKTVCAFANTEGGIIIWGIECSRSRDAEDG